MLIRIVEEQDLKAQVLHHEDMSLIFLKLKFVLWGADKMFHQEKRGISAAYFFTQG